MAETLEYRVSLDGIKESNKEIKTFSDAFKDVAIQAGKVTVALYAVSKGFNTITQSAQAFFTQQRAENQVEQALKTTGNTANLTAEELKKAARELQNVSNFGDEDILANATGSLLTFKNIAGETFLRTQQIVVDMAEKFGGLQNSAMQVGFALNAPSEGLTRLRRAGVQFSEQQIEQIKLYEETNQIVKAQTIMLEELESQFGGLAKASINPISQMKNAWSDFVEAIGSSFVPIFNNLSAFTKALSDNEAMANVFATAMKIGLAVGVAVATKAVIGLILKMKTLIATMATAKALAGDWVSILISVGVGIGSVALITTDWTKEQNGLNKELGTSKTSLADLLKSTKGLLEINSRSVDENKSLQASLKTLSDNYGIIIPLESDRADKLKAINDALTTQEELNKVDPAKLIQEQIASVEKSLKQAELMRDKFAEKPLFDEPTNLKKITDWFLGLSQSSTAITEAGKSYNKYKKEAEDYANQLIALREQLILLNEEPLKPQVIKVDADISALSTYYNTVKFADTEYFEFKKSLNIKEADEYKKLLISKGYSEQEALDFRNKYYEQMNNELMESQRTWLQEMQELSDSYAPAQQGEAITWDTSWMTKTLEEQKKDIATYYETVKGMDDNYYQWKSEQIALEVENMAISDEKKEILLQQRLLNIQKETQAYQDQASMINTAINSITNSLVSFAQISTENLSNVQKLWANLANAVIAEIGRMMAKMMAMKLLQASLSFLGFAGFGAGSAVGISVPDIVGGFASTSMPATPSINNNNNQSGNNGTRGIVEKLNEVVDAINNSSIKQLIRPMDNIMLARNVEAGNIARGVL